MPKALKPALLGDRNAERFGWLQAVLDEEYGLETVQARTFDELQQLVEQSNKTREQTEENQSKKGLGENDWSLVFVADDLPPTHTKKPTQEIVKIYFTLLESLNKWGDFSVVLISTQKVSIDWRGITPPRIIHLSNPPKPEELQGISNELDGLSGLKRVSRAESKLSWDKDNRILREQIRGLSEVRNVLDGVQHLARLVSRCFDCSKVDKIEIKQLGQGRSGASVFRLCVESGQRASPGIEREEFVLKLCKAGKVWKLESEVRGHTQAKMGLGHPGYREHIPRLNRAETFRQANEYIVRSSHWCAVHFDFVGGNRFGKFVDLETALVGSTRELEEKLAGTDFEINAANPEDVRAMRVRIFETLLRWLCDNWYTNPETEHLRRRQMVVWDTGNAPEKEYVVMPPYQLTGRSKGWIQSFLDSSDAQLGERFFPDWEKHIERVSRLVSEDEPLTSQLGQLAKPMPVVLSHVHGDLNASNILLWLKHHHPFLIDFPFYQEAGHALQDLARLEVEIKFALLDRQKDSPKELLQAFEHSYSQLWIWGEMEDRLLNQWEQPASTWTSKGYKENVQFSYELVQMIRHRAYDVQQNSRCIGPPAGDFLDEYWIALLYHTLRAISYSSLSVFKRLLAVYSAASILKKLDCFNDLD